MTYAEFFRRLAKIKRKWHVTHEGNIRSGHTCPVAAVARKRGCEVFTDTGDSILPALGKSKTVEIVSAADTWAIGGSLRLRNRMLKAVRLA
jgi:hypothetical protein